MENTNEILERIKIKNEALNQKLNLATHNLKDKIKEEKEKINIIIEAENLLFLRKLSTISMYKDFSIKFAGEGIYYIYYNFSPGDTTMSIIEITKENISIIDYKERMSAYRAINIYNQLYEDIEGLINEALIKIQNRYDEIKLLYKSN